jgi:hypothetical protein
MIVGVIIGVCIGSLITSVVGFILVCRKMDGMFRR